MVLAHLLERDAAHVVHDLVEGALHVQHHRAQAAARLAGDVLDDARGVVQRGQAHRLGQPPGRVDGEDDDAAPGLLLPIYHRAQMEHQLIVSGAERILFMGSEWDADGNLVEERHCWYKPNRELAAKITTASPLTVKIGKQAFYRQIDLPQAQAYEAMAETMATNAVTCDAQEGMQAFVDKRKPEWRNK